MLRLPELDWTVLAAGMALALLVLLVAWRLFAGKRGAARARHHRPDVLDEGVGPAQRNQALIDAPPAATIADPASGLASTGPDIMAGMGEAIAAATREQAADAQADDLTRIKGVGPKLAAMLGQLGITRYAQIADWDEADLARIDAQLGSFAGRPRRDAWVDQARLLATGDTQGFEGRFGKMSAPGN